jgi:hypothetical protein
VFGIFSSFALEALIFFGIFAIDLKTGAHDGGFLHCEFSAGLRKS